MKSSFCCGIIFLVAFLAARSSFKIDGIIAFSLFGNCANRQILYPEITFCAAAFGFFLTYLYVSYFTSTYSYSGRLSYINLPVLPSFSPVSFINSSFKLYSFVHTLLSCDKFSLIIDEGYREL